MRLLLLSNSTNPGETFLSYPSSAIQSFLGQGIKNVLFVPYAAVDISLDEYFYKVQQRFNDFGYQMVSIHHGDPVQRVSEAEAIVVGGGNSFALLHRIYESNVRELIRERVSNGVPYIGWSAGSNLACPTIKTTNDMPIIMPEKFDALQLFPFQINPHFTELTIQGHGGESRLMRLKEFCIMNPEMQVFGLPEGCYLLQEGDRLTYHGDKEYVVMKGREVVRTKDSSPPVL
jgi:dipeptidase E